MFALVEKFVVYFFEFLFGPVQHFRKSEFRVKMLLSYKLRNFLGNKRIA